MRKLSSKLVCCVRSVIELLDKDTVLFVFGDHGMTRSGDHGGDSFDELDAALFVYSPSTLTLSPSVSQVIMHVLYL